MFTKLWHISDLHLSFDECGNIKKSMDQRTWSKGSTNYVGYLDKIKQFSDNNITHMDFVAITGDIVHEMSHRFAICSLRWIRENIRGTIIIIRGNHDRRLEFHKYRREISIPNMFFVMEGETLTVGPYTFGCYSDHKNESHWGEHREKFDDLMYNHVITNTITQAKRTSTLPVFLSHYPCPPDVIKKAGKDGLKAYLSGHVHCTKNEENILDWYHKTAGLTDNKVINGCHCSTGTTDTMLIVNNEIFRSIATCHAGEMDIKKRNSMQQNVARKFFNCSAKHVSYFCEEDPFNKGNVVSGFICRKPNTLFGSIVITHVNGIACEHQMIYGTPKLQYPYDDNSVIRRYKNLEAQYIYLANKWDGTNILFYKYYDNFDNVRVTAKSRGTPFVHNGTFGSFVDLVNEALAKQNSDLQKGIFESEFLMQLLMNAEQQSVTCELYGRKEPHLVKYNVDIELQPLFTTDNNGDIRPYIYDRNMYAKIEDNKHIAQICKEHQKIDLAANEEYRLKEGLPHRYEYEHFIAEGKVLYLLNTDGVVIDRILYKIKPKDIEEVHWASFDTSMRDRVREVYKKMIVNKMDFTTDNLQSELEMGPKEWDKYKRDVFKYIDELKTNVPDKREVVILCGLPCSGKTTLAKKMESEGWTRINQDDMGSRKACKRAMANALQDKNKTARVVIDRVNFDVNQRKSWLEIANGLRVPIIRCVKLDVSIDECKNRMASRTDHPTIKDAETGDRVIDQFAQIWTEPVKEEGFTDIITFKDENIDDILKALTTSTLDDNKKVE